MDKKILEFWGQFFLNAARSQEQMDHMNKLLGKYAQDENPLLDSLYKSFGLPKPQKVEVDDLFDLAKKSTAVWQDLVKSSLYFIEVVPKDDYQKLLKENEELRLKIADQERIISSFNNSSEKNSSDQEKFVSSLTDIMKNQTQQFQELMKQINLSYKADGQDKKNKK